MSGSTSKEKEDNGLPEMAMPRGGQRIYTTWPDMIKHWPKTTFCIISNEFCERFSYYGMRTVLTFYILNVLKFDANTTTVFFNSFTILCYLTPMLGSIIADGYIGKFWTIFSVSILYAIGQVILAISSVQNYESSVHPWLDLLGLAVIGFGTGGIKPCVAAFGADQFGKGQERMLSVYFSMFYFSINAGSMISTFISPIFRSQPCLGQDSCYPLAFGIPAVLMIVATGLFILGSPWYEKPPPEWNIFAEIGRIIGGAIGNKVKGRKTGSEKNWIDYYLATHDCATDVHCQKRVHKKKNRCQKEEMVEDVRVFLRLLVMLLPVPMFWALYDQQGSVWLIQAIQMDCNVFGFLLLPDQMQTLNAVLILMFIPLFQVVVYPLASKLCELTPLRKMVAGGWLASLAFLITGFVQLQVNTTLPQLPKDGGAFVSFMNVFDDPSCNFTVSPTGDFSPHMLAFNTSMVDIKDESSTFHINSGSHTFNIAYGDSCVGPKPAALSYSFDEKTVNYIAIGKLGAIKHESDTDKPTEGTGEFNFGVTMMTDEPYEGNLALCREDAADYDKHHPCDPQTLSNFQYWETDYNGHTDDRAENITIIGDDKSKRTATAYEFKPVKPGKWALYFMLNRPRDVDHQTYSKKETNVSFTGVRLEVNGQGGVYAVVVTGDGLQLDNVFKQGKNKKHIYQVVQDNKVNILWQVPQIVVLTAAEILFSITGYEFAYSQTSPSMKAVVQAVWLLTTAFGDAIIVVITLLDMFDDMAVMFFVYAGAMFVVIGIFAVMGIFYYDYHYYTRVDDDDDDDETLAIDNNAYVPEKAEISWASGGMDEDDLSVMKL